MNSVASAIWQLGPMNYSEMHYSEMLWRIKQSDIRPKRCIFRASASDKPGDRRRFRRAPLASSTGHDWLHALAGCCPSPVIGKAVFARFVGGATSNGLHAEAIVHMVTRCDTLVFSGSTILTCAHSLVPIEVMTFDFAIRAFQASQQASRIASYVSQTQLLRALPRRYSQMFSAGFSSGA